MEEIRIVFTSDWPDQEKITQKLIDIDRECFGEISFEDEGNLEDWMVVHKRSFVHVLFAGEEAVGYIDLTAITQEGEEKLLSGTFHDGLIRPYVDLSDTKTVTLYLVAIALLPKYRNKGYAKRLWNASRDHFLSQGIRVKRIYGTVWSPEGAGFFKKIGGQEVGEDNSGHPIMTLTPEEETLPTL